MNIFITVCNYKENSFNHAIADVVKKNYDTKENTIFYHDLYKENFNPVLSEEEFLQKDLSCVDEYVQKICNELISSDIIIIIHPNWWGQPPALLKGWLDRMFRIGIAYRFDETGKAVGLLKAKKAYVFNTSNTPEPVEMNIYKDPLDNLWKTCIFGMCGVKNVQRLMFKGVIKSTKEMRGKWLEDVLLLINN